MVAVIVLLAAGAYADQIANDIDATVDADFEMMTLNQGEPDRRVGLYVVPTNGDGKLECNLTGGNPLFVSVKSSNTSVATVSPAVVPFTHCGLPATPIFIHPVGQGTATITVAPLMPPPEPPPSGTFQFDTATFTVNVQPPPNTPPTVAVTGVAGGASYPKSAVPTPGCLVSDTEDGLSNSTTAASPNVGPVQGPNAADGIGQQTVTCAYTDHGGLQVVASATYAIVDPSPPTIDSTLDPASPNGDNGWYISDVSLTWQVNEPESPSSLEKPAGQCVDQTIASDQGPTTYTCSASSVGGSAGPQSVTIKRDASTPTITASATTPDGPYTGGWTNQTVTVHFACSDVGPSGLAGACPDDKVVSDSTSAGGQNISASIADLAGNVGHSNLVTVKVDKDAPLISLASRTPANGNGWNSTDVALHWTCADGLSGPAASGDSVVLQSEGAGQSATGHCSDNAGNTASDTVSDINIDKTAPTGVVATLARDADHNGWYNAPVGISATGTDALSGIADCDNTPYSGPDSATASASRGCTDKAGNRAADSVSFKFDDTDPTLSPSVSPNPVVLNGSATTAAGADDATSGVDAANTGCDSVSTSSVGAHSVACTATDNAGNQANKSATYSVIYATGGSCLGSPSHQILQPINANWQTDLSVFKQGSTVPAKFRVCDANGVSIGTAGVVTKFALTQKLSLAASETVDEAVYSTTPDTAFRWSSPDQQWIFNITTKTLKAGTTYVYQITLNDGSTIDFRFGLK
jgi:hypothetical protein